MMISQVKQTVEMTYAKVFIWISVIFLYAMLLHTYNNPNSFPFNAFLLVYIGSAVFSFLFLLGLAKSLNLFGIDSRICKLILMGLVCVLALKMLSPILLNNPELYYITAFKNYSIYTREMTDIFFCIAFFAMGYFIIPRYYSEFLTVFIILNIYNATALSLYHLKQNQSLIHQNKLNTIQIKNKKNVYFILVDSLANTNALQDLGIISGIHSEIDKIKQKGFEVYNSFHTSLQPTKYALYSFLDMNYKRHGELGYSLSDKERYALIMGEGQVFQQFRSNGYKINIIHEVDFFQSKNCHGDLCFFSAELKKIPLSSLAISIATFLFLPDSYYRKNLFWDPRYNDRQGQKHFTQDLLNHLSVLEPSKKYFSYIHFFSNPGHSSSEFSQANPCNEKRETELYAERVHEAFQFIDRVTDRILKSDPDSVIIFAGDHGPYIYQHCSSNEIATDRKSIDERQGAFLAIHWGKDYHGEYDKQIKTSHNLFRYILTYLSQDDATLKSKPNDFTFVKRDSFFSSDYKRAL